MPMNKIEKLIKELCPNGVEWKKLEEVCDIVSGKDYKHLQNGNIPVYGSGGIMTFVNKSAYDKPTVLLPRKGSISNVFYVNGPFWNVDTIYYTKIYEHIIDTKYLFYYLQREHIEKYCTSDAARPALTRECLSKIQIPLPPLPIQTEIVRILDKFVEQQEQLEKLIELRKKQYEYYREEMLKPKEGEVWETKRLGEIAEVTKLAGFEFTEYVEYSDEGKIIALRGLNVKDGKLVLDDVKYIDNSNFSKLNRSKLLKNDLLYTYVGTVGQSAIIEEDDKYYLAPNVAMIRVKSQDVLISKYLLFYLLSSKFKNSELEKLTASSSMKNITMEKIRKFNIVFPSVSKQKDIINTLVNFESSIAALTSALEASKKRYEYYRDKMMRF